MGSPVVHFEIRADDLSRQKSFYAELFGWEMGPEATPLHYSMIDTRAGAGIAGGIRASEPGPRGLTFYVQVEDLEETLVRVQRLGGMTAMPPMELLPGGRFAVVRDLEGNELGLLGR